MPLRLPPLPAPGPGVGPAGYAWPLRGFEFVISRFDTRRRCPWKVSDPHRGVGRVNGLSARTGRAINVDADFIRVDLNFAGFFRLGKYQHAGRRGVDAPLGLSYGHPLNAVDATLVFQVRPHAIFCRASAPPLYRDRDGLRAAQIRFGVI